MARWEACSSPFILSGSCRGTYSQILFKGTKTTTATLNPKTTTQSKLLLFGISGAMDADLGSENLVETVSAAAWGLGARGSIKDSYKGLGVWGLWI